jgi:hypothetical protein
LRNEDPASAGEDAPAHVDETHATTRRFSVRGERFSLDPTELLALFPPSNNNGEYVNVLPHAVFHRRTLPWERSPELRVDGASWLAILLFEADEVPPLQPRRPALADAAAARHAQLRRRRPARQEDPDLPAQEHAARGIAPRHRGRGASPLPSG